MRDALEASIPEPGDNPSEFDVVPMDVDYDNLVNPQSDEEEDADDDYWSDSDDDDLVNAQEISHVGGEYGPNVSVAQRTFSLMTSTNKYILTQFYFVFSGLTFDCSTACDGISNGGSLSTVATASMPSSPTGMTRLKLWQMHT